jgi:hypothetical protein
MNLFYILIDNSQYYFATKLKNKIKILQNK